MTASKTSTILEPSKISRADKPTSFSVADFPMPTGKEEEWRFTPMRRIRTLLDDSSPFNGKVTVSVDAPETVSVEDVQAGDARLGHVIAPGDRASVLAWEKFASATVVTIPREVELDQPVFINVAAADELAAAHILVKAESLSKGTVVLLHKGPAKLTETVEIRAEDGATLSVVSVQEWDRDALHASNHRISVGRDANLRHMIVTLGGDTVRISVDTEFTAPGGNMNLNGIYFVDQEQHLEHRVFVHHAQPNCFSRVAYKGALQGKNARSVWIGDCLIGKNADATDTYELNRNLILTEGAKADSVPNLEIENGEIEGAGHASATGRFDDDQLFYLMSRGVSALDARRLVVRGFFAELINEIGVPELQEHLMGAIDEELRDYNKRLALEA